ncbi:MAG: arginine--tRNA ligase [Thermodesulfovibrio sp.]|nr:arginine--tRNA ligase [Thermodesulfovibrio sp.]
MKKETINILQAAMETLGISPCPPIDVEVPKTGAFGDISTPLAMGLSRTLKKAPRKIAEEIVAAIKDRGPFEKIEIAGPGFINFSLSKDYLRNTVSRLLMQDRSLLREDIGQGRRVLVEYVSANPTGPLHIGHARGAAVGNALCNLLEEMGYGVEREYYINDFGRQIKLLGMSVHAQYQLLLGGASEFPEEGYRGQYIVDVAQELLAEKAEAFKDVPFSSCGSEITAWAYLKMLDLIKSDVSIFGIKKYDNWVSERDLYDRGEVGMAITDLRDRGYIYEKDGAVWFRSTDFTDDKDRVIIKTDGSYTYFSSDIAYHKDKLDRQFDIIVDIWGADHHGYIPRIESVMQAFGYDSSKFKVILVQMVNLLKHGEPFKMSKRAGTFVTLSDVVELVGADTTKFIFLTRKADSHLDFDLDVVTAQSAENPVFYVQYAHARINSILDNAKTKGIDLSALGNTDLSGLELEEELTLIKKLLTYPIMLESAARACEPHRITYYLQELAGLFHAYYHQHKVLTEDMALSLARLALCSAVRVVLLDALTILGVTAPEKM